MQTDLSEHAIRPADTAAEQQRLFMADLSRLMQQRHRFIEVACPACDSTARTQAFEKHQQKYQRCNTCETVYISPRPPPDVLREYYATSESYRYWNEVIFPRSEETRRERIFKPRVDRVLQLAPQARSLLEVGAGFGTFLSEAKDRGHYQRLVAIEPTPSLAATCRQRGLDVIEAPVETASAEPADIVVSFEVIEHAFDPGAFIAACKALTRDWLILTCPNVRGFDVEVLGAGSPAIDFEHLNYFHPASLRALLERHGFRVTHVETPGRLDADIVRNRALAGEHTLLDPFLRRVLIDEWERLGEAFQTFLSAQGLSSHMWIVARRTGLDYL